MAPIKLAVSPESSIAMAEDLFSSIITGAMFSVAMFSVAAEVFTTDASSELLSFKLPGANCQKTNKITPTNPDRVNIAPTVNAFALFSSDYPLICRDYRGPSDITGPSESLILAIHPLVFGFQLNLFQLVLTTRENPYHFFLNADLKLVHVGHHQYQLGTMRSLSYMAITDRLRWYETKTKTKNK